VACKLCLQENELRQSHIIPEWAYKPAYNAKHKIVRLRPSDSAPVSTYQKGLREELLCQKCETKLSGWENELSRVVKAASGEPISGISVTQIDSRYRIIGGFDYAAVKLAIVSIFWRMSVSHLTEFLDFNLGPYESKYRVMLDQNDSKREHQHPIIVFRLLLNGHHNPDMMMVYTQPIRYDDKYFMNKIVMYGFQFTLFSTDPEPWTSFSPICLRENGSIMVSDQRMGTDAVGPILHDLMRSEKVQRFYRNP